MVNLYFCITYVKNTKINIVTYLTATKIFLVYPVNCCSNYKNIVSDTIHVGIPCIFWFITITKTFFTIGINHGFECINICQVPRKVFEHEAEG